MLTREEMAVFRENLTLIESRSADLDRLLILQFTEAADRFSRSLPKRGALAPVSDCRTLFGGITGEDAACTLTFARFAKVFAGRFPQDITPRALFPKGENEGEGTAFLGRVSYLQNGYTDRAYRIFSSRRKGVTAAYLSGYAAACEDVYYGRSEYTILPLYNAVDGRLSTFGRMLAKYDLKVADACLLESDDGGAVMYGLIKKQLSSWEGDFLDLTTVLPETVSAGEFLEISSLFGLQLLLINALPMEYDAVPLMRHELCFHFLSREADLGAFALFLEAAHLRYNIEGCYSL